MRMLMIVHHGDSMGETSREFDLPRGWQLHVETGCGADRAGCRIEVYPVGDGTIDGDAQLVARFDVTPERLLFSQAE